MSRPTSMTLTREPGLLRAIMPSGRNVWYYPGAVLFGIPWLVGIVIGVAVAIRRIPSSRVALVWIAALLGTVALTVLLDVLALALIWLSLYSLVGREVLEVTSSEILVRRIGAGVTMRAHAKRGHFDRVSRLDPRRSPGRVPHPTVEVSGAYSRLRVGSGLNAAEADALVAALREFIGQVGPEQIVGREARVQVQIHPRRFRDV